jgi:hypothetical protein
MKNLISHVGYQGGASILVKRMSEHRTLTFVGSRDGSIIEEVAFSAQIFLTIGDQPERRGGNCLLGGKSRSHRRWRYACNLSSLVSIVPACKDCYALMLDCDSKSRSIAVQWKRECSACYNWMSKGIDDPMLRYKPGEDFPKGYVLGGVPCIGGVNFGF